MPSSFRKLVFPVLALIFFSGCGESLDVAEVDGVLLLNGKPANKIRIQFHPQYVEGKKTGPASTADTDENGKFQLQLLDRQGGVRPGAVVGMHSVTLYDLAIAASPTGEGLPLRVRDEWKMPGSTKLTQEIKPGKQTLELKYP